MLACLRFAENPRDRVSGFRVLQLLPGVGPTTAGRMLDRLAAPDAAAMLVTYAPPRAGAAWEDFAALFGRLLRRESGWPAELAQVREWYEPHLQRIHEDAHMRAADLNQLEQIAAGYPTRERFLTDLTLDPPNAASDEAGAPLLDEDYLILSTIHSAKGQEWKSVFVLNAVDGCIPSDLATGSTDEIEEERRLLYVAMTRARTTSTSSCRIASTCMARRATATATCTPAHAFHPALGAAAVRTADVAGAAGEGGGQVCRTATTARRPDRAHARDVAVTFVSRARRNV